MNFCIIFCITVFHYIFNKGQFEGRRQWCRSDVLWILFSISYLHYNEKRKKQPNSSLLDVCAFVCCVCERYTVHMFVVSLCVKLAFYLNYILSSNSVMWGTSAEMNTMNSAWWNCFARIMLSCTVVYTKRCH